MSDTAGKEHYLELYKKYRPQTWDDIIGQDPIVAHLKHCVESGHIPTLFGFFGQRGTGKSSAAYVLAKSLNCESLSGANPCGRCSSCIEAENGTLTNVNFVSMANDGSVDNVRQIVQNARVRAFNGRKQIWILDEVHNLSKAAFDSLLVPLDDNDISKSALFIMCSTAPEKIPDTLLSRCRTFKFRPVGKEALTAHLEKVARQEGLDEGTTGPLVEKAVRASGGSVRQAMSTFEASLYGTDSGESTFYDYLILAAIANLKVDKMLSHVRTAIDAGVDGVELIEYLLADCRDLLIVSAGGDLSLTDLKMELDVAAKLARMLGGEEGLKNMHYILGTSLESVGFAGDSRTFLEIALVRILMAVEKQRKGRG